MRLTKEDMERRAAADLQHYGFPVDRKKALRELHPPLSVVLREAPRSSVEAQIAALRKTKEQ